MSSDDDEPRMISFQGTASTITISGYCTYCHENPAEQLLYGDLLCGKCFDRILEFEIDK